MMNSPAIVIVAYNRARSLKRLLQSISQANYTQKNIILIISIDYSNSNQDVVDLAKQFVWKHGEKKVACQEHNLGLRNHILKCGSYASTHGSVIILEDDLYVSPNFYLFAQVALEFSEQRPYISGISLYSHQFNVHSRSQFFPIIDGYDNWYFQFASSWGQAWTKKQWEAFYDWYKLRGTIVKHPSLPNNVTRWSDKSWLKYFICYLVETNSYFLYPRNSYTTNFSDTGTHVGKDSTTYQVPLDFGNLPRFNFSGLEESNSVYDVFYENTKLYTYLNLQESELCIDLYGIKPIPQNQRYILTDRILPHKQLRSFGRSLKPHDANIIANMEGDDLFLYDCLQALDNHAKFNSHRKIIYNLKEMNLDEAKQVFIYLFKERFRNLFKKIGI